MAPCDLGVLRTQEVRGRMVQGKTVCRELISGSRPLFQSRNPDNLPHTQHFSVVFLGGKVLLKDLNSVSDSFAIFKLCFLGGAKYS